MDDKMSKEPKSPKGSERFWTRHGQARGMADYNKLVSLEAKIEFCTDHKLYLIKEEYQSEYDQLLKEHNL